MTRNFEKLKDHILSLSEADDFDAARKEWDLINVEVSEELGKCPCGQSIKEHCHIRNNLNGNTTWVGNVCIKRFIGINTGQLFAGLKRIVQNPSANPNEDLIIYADEFGYIYSKEEYQFLMNIRHKRNQSQKQIAWKKKINRRIINKIVVQKHSGSKTKLSLNL